MRRLDLLLTVVVVVAVAGPAAAQAARAVGMVRDIDGRAIRGATVRAVNPQGHPKQITSATDNKGRWAMIGLTSGEWQFVADAPGFVTQNATAMVRISGSAPLVFTLTRDPRPAPGTLDKNIQRQLGDANTLRDQGRYDQALTAYQDIRTKNPKLTSIHLVMAEAYRRKAAQEADPAARRSLLNLAIESYGELLKDDAGNARALDELEATRTEASGAANGLTK